MSKEKIEAERIYNDHYVGIFEYGEELSKEIVISLLAKKSALIHVDFLLRITPMYLGNLNADWVFYQKVKQEIEKL